MFTSNITIEAVIAIYTSAIPFDLIHSIASVVFIYVLSDFMIEKLERIKIKYGLIC